jgi:hypothetical protein
MKTLTSKEMLDAMDAALAEVDRKLAAGELDQSGRFWSDEELAAGAATGKSVKPPRESEPSAA